MVMSDRIALLRMGGLEQVASPREIYSHPSTAYTAQFIGHTNLLKGAVKAGVAVCNQLSWTVSAPDGPALFSLRPEHIRIAGVAASSNMIRVRGRVLHQVFHGATDLIRVECGEGLVLVARMASTDTTLTDVELEFSPADAVLVRESVERI